jgi:hypothetical protein
MSGYEPVFGPPITDLWIGAPGRTVDGLASAGAVDHDTLVSTGAVTLHETITENAIPNLSQHFAAAGNRFGSVLAAGEDGTFDNEDDSALLVGVPNETVNGHAQAGAVYYINEIAFGGMSRRVTQNTTPVDPEEIAYAGVAEAGDHFGASLAFGQVAAIGVPGEDIGTIKDAGMVQLARIFAADGKALAAFGSISQDTPGVPGVSEAGDRFGTAVATLDASCDNTSRIAIGVPGEDLDGVRDASDVTLATVHPFSTPGRPRPRPADAGVPQPGHRRPRRGPRPGRRRWRRPDLQTHDAKHRLMRLQRRRHPGTALPAKPHNPNHPLTPTPHEAADNSPRSYRVAESEGS